MHVVYKSILFGVVLATAACANDPYQRTKIGAATGAVVGGVLGHQLDDDSGRYIGAAVGALAGGALGNYMDRQQQAYEQTLASEQQRYNLEIQRQANTLRVVIPSEVSFDLDSAQLKPSFYPTLDKVAGLLQQYQNSVATIEGHTDSSGSDNYNLDLSRRRAESVAQYLASRGVPGNRLRTVGYGESRPRANNNTASGRQLNRRVELLIQPSEQAGVPQQAAGQYPPQQSGYYAPQYPPPSNPY